MLKDVERLSCGGGEERDFFNVRTCLRGFACSSLLL